MKTLLDGKTEWRYNPKWSLNDPLESPIWKDGRLSMKAKGVWGYMKSKHYGWDFSASRMAVECKDETKSIQRAMKELRGCGYLSSTKLKTGRVHYFIVDDPWVGIEPEITKSPLAGYAILMDEPSVDIKGSSKDAVEALMLAYGVHGIAAEDASAVVGDMTFDSYDGILSWMNSDKDSIDSQLDIGEAVGF